MDIGQLFCEIDDFFLTLKNNRFPNLYRLTILGSWSLVKMIRFNQSVSS